MYIQILISSTRHRCKWHTLVQYQDQDSDHPAAVSAFWPVHKHSLTSLWKGSRAQWAQMSKTWATEGDKACSLNSRGCQAPSDKCCGNGLDKRLKVCEGRGPSVQGIGPGGRMGTDWIGRRREKELSSELLPHHPCDSHGWLHARLWATHVTYITVFNP